MLVMMYFVQGLLPTFGSSWMSAASYFASSLATSEFGSSKSP